MRSFRDMPLADEAGQDIDARTEELSAQISDLEARLAPFETPLWQMLEVEISLEHSQQTHQLIEGPYTTDQLWQTRGRLQALNWLLMLPEKIRHDLTAYQNELAELTDQGES